MVLVMAHTKNPTATNPNSYKEIVALGLGEQLCAEHAASGSVVSDPHMGICYACAITHKEPKRLR